MSEKQKPHTPLDFETALVALRNGESQGAASRAQGCESSALRKIGERHPDKKLAIKDAEEEGLLLLVDRYHAALKLWKQQIVDAHSDGDHDLARSLVQLAKLDLDGMRWELGKRLPHLYGDRTALDIGGQPSGAPILIRWRDSAVDGPTPGESDGPSGDAKGGA